MAGGWQALNTPSERGAAAFGFYAAGFDFLILTPIPNPRSVSGGEL